MMSMMTSLEPTALFLNITRGLKLDCSHNKAPVYP